jgi:hypothetical protein
LRKALPFNKELHKVDFFGEEDLAHSGGVGGPEWTERLPVRFEWLAAA